MGNLRAVSRAQRVEVVVVVEVAGGNCVVEVSWCVVVVDVVSGVDEQAPRPRVTEAAMARRKSLVFMWAAINVSSRADQCLEVVVVVVSVDSVLLTVTGAVRLTTTLLTTGWPSTVV